MSETVQFAIDALQVLHEEKEERSDRAIIYRLIVDNMMKIFPSIWTLSGLRSLIPKATPVARAAPKFSLSVLGRVPRNQPKRNLKTSWEKRITNRGSTAINHTSRSLDIKMKNLRERISEGLFRSVYVETGVDIADVFTRKFATGIF